MHPVMFQNSPRKFNFYSWQVFRICRALGKFLSSEEFHGRAFIRRFLIKITEILRKAYVMIVRRNLFHYTTTWPWIATRRADDTRQYDRLFFAQNGEKPRLRFIYVAVTDRKSVV